MPVISPDTFDPLQRYVGVRLQQGVPIVDADENEREDVRKFELRAFLKWFVGDGVPEGNDGFRIEGTGLTNDFMIRRGTGAPPAGVSNVEIGLRHVGRCLVDGMDVIITADLKFTDQPLHASQPNAAALSTRLGVPTITMPAPADQTLTVYLDVWERLVLPTEDTDLLLPGLGTESCARMCREWAVRVRTGTVVPVPGNGDYLTGHSYYPLASILRRPGPGTINALDVTDLREKRLLAPPATLISDVLGVQPLDYRRGQGRPVFNLRNAINALLRGEMPGTNEAPFAPDPAIDFMSHGFTVVGDLAYATWTSRRVGNLDQVYLARWNAADPNGAASATITPITSGGLAHRLPHLVTLPTNELIVVYETAATDIHFKRVNLSTLEVGAEQALATTGGLAERHPFAVLVGTTVFFFWHQGGATPFWMYRRWRYTDSTFLDGAGVQLTATNAAAVSAIVGGFHATVDAGGNVWGAFTAADKSMCGWRIRPDLTVESFNIATGLVADNDEPFTVVEGNNAVWFFWTNHPSAPQYFIYFQRVPLQPIPASWGSNPPTALVSGSVDSRPASVYLSDGSLWLFWRHTYAVNVNGIFGMRHDPFTDSWGAQRQISSAKDLNDQPMAVAGPCGVIQVFWSTQRGGNTDIYTRLLGTVI